jgi:hypothetical protein
MEFTIPHSLMLICLGLAGISLLLARFRLGLSITLSLAFFWGFIESKDLFFVNLESSSTFLGLYLISGTVLIVVTLFSFLNSE